MLISRGVSTRRCWPHLPPHRVGVNHCAAEADSAVVVDILLVVAECSSRDRLGQARRCDESLEDCGSAGSFRFRLGLGFWLRRRRLLSGRRLLLGKLVAEDAVLAVGACARGVELACNLPRLRNGAPVRVLTCRSVTAFAFAFGGLASWSAL